MSAISLKSIIGITSITTPAGVDNQFTLHNNNTTEAVKLDNAGNLHFHNHLNITGVSTFSGGIGSTITIAAGVGSTAITLDNSHQIAFGSANELAMFHDGTNSYIKQRYFSYPSRLKIISENSSIDIMSGSGGGLHGGYENATTNGGIIVQGNITLGQDIIHHGDTNTKISFPAADTITAETAGSERLRIDSSGRIGMGINNPGDYQSSSNDLVLGKESDTGGMTIRSGTSNGGYIRFADGTSGNQAYRGSIIYSHSLDSFLFATDSTEKLRINSTGVVNIGDSTASSLGDRLLQIGKTDRSATYIELRTSTSGVGGIVFSDGTDNSNTGYRGTIEYAHGSSNSDSMYFKTAAQERLRINSSGIVTKPFQPAFSAQGTGGTTDSTQGYTGILSNYMSVIECNVGGHYKTSGTDNGKFIAPVAGNYFFSGGCLLRLRSGQNGSGELSFYKNGSNISARSLGYSYVLGTNYHDNVTITAIISLAAGDKVHLVSHACSGNLDWYWGEGLGNFNGFLIG